MAYFISRRFMLFLNRFTVLVRVLRRWQGKMKPWSLDSRTVDVLKLIEKMVFTPHDIAIEPWFLRQEGKHASDVHVGLNSYWTSTVRAFAPRPVEWGWSAGPERFSQVWTRMAAVACKSGQELCTSITPSNYANSVTPEDVAFFITCFEYFVLMKCAAKEDRRRPVWWGGKPGTTAASDPVVGEARSSGKSATCAKMISPSTSSPPR